MLYLCPLSSSFIFASGLSANSVVHFDKFSTSWVIFGINHLSGSFFFDKYEFFKTELFDSSPLSVDGLLGAASSYPS